MIQVLYLLLIIFYLIFIFIYVKKQNNKTTLIQKITNIVVSIYFIYNIFNIYQIYYGLQVVSSIFILLVYIEHLYLIIKNKK